MLHVKQPEKYLKTPLKSINTDGTDGCQIKLGREMVYQALKML